ncbi:Uncharacterized protein Rs2_05278 [Raphanus sativus]|nr:Uncharacterized protein Rs2_05278 [Raphanus sativus]
MFLQGNCKGFLAILLQICKSFCLNFEQLPRHYTFSNCFNLSSQLISEFLEKSLTRVASIARAHQQELTREPEVSICIPSDARQIFSFLLQPGPDVMIDSPWTRKPLSGLAISVVVSFQDDCQNVAGLGIRCICTWQTRNGYLGRMERLFQCWAPLEAPKVERDHVFIIYETQMHTNGSEENPNLWVKFEFHAVSWDNKLLGDKCMVTQCGVRVITAPGNDTNTMSSEITNGSEVDEDHRPTSSRIMVEANSPTPLPSNERRTVSRVQSKLRSKLWKWMRTINYKKQKTRKVDSTTTRKQGLTDGCIPRHFLGITVFRGNTEEHSRRNYFLGISMFLGISSEISDEIPRKLISEGFPWITNRRNIPRNIPRTRFLGIFQWLFRWKILETSVGNILRKSSEISEGKFPRNIVRARFLGNFRGNIPRHLRRNFPRKTALRIFRGMCPSEISEGFFLAIFNFFFLNL